MSTLAPDSPSSIAVEPAPSRSTGKDPAYSVTAFHLRYRQHNDGLKDEANFAQPELDGYQAYLDGLWDRPRAEWTTHAKAESAEAARIGDEYRRAKDLSRLDNGNFSDASNAGYLESKMVPDWIWSWPRAQWLRWTGHRFEPDTHGRVINDAMLRMRERTIAFASMQTDTKARDLASAVGAENLQRVKAALEVLKTFPSINSRGDELDKNPFVLGVANGVLDFQADTPFRPGHPSDLITKSTGIPFDAAESAPRFLQFLREIFMGDDELIRWFQRVVGYTLTGSTLEQVLFMLYGTGANGKSVLLTVLRLLLGEYAVNLPMSALERDTNPGPNRASPDLMMLRGARLATSSEVSAASQLSENRVKALTGGDEVTGRDLNKSNETFKPEAKYFLAVNHPPIIKDDSDGMWRRMRMIPFPQRFTYDGSAEKGNLRDDDLEAKLAAELPGIQAWAVRGALSWMSEHLGDTPAAVLAATSAYQAESDHYGQFIEERCELGEHYTVTASAFYKAYEEHCYENGIKTKPELRTGTQFGRDMKSRPGIRKEKQGGRMLYFGIGLSAEPQQGTLPIAAAAPAAAWTN